MQFNVSTLLLAHDCTIHGHSQPNIDMRLTSCVDGSMMILLGSDMNTAMLWSTEDQDENVVVCNGLQIHV